MLDHGYMVSDCSFEFHITNLIKRTNHLTGWMLRTFSSRDKLTVLTLFKALVMSSLDYGSQLCPPPPINMVEKTQRYFTRYISGMQGLSYPERLTVLKLYSLQLHSHLCLEDFGVLSSKLFTFLLLYILEHLIVEEVPVLAIERPRDKNSKGTRLYFVILLKNVEQIFDWH